MAEQELNLYKIPTTDTSLPNAVSTAGDVSIGNESLSQNTTNYKGITEQEVRDIVNSVRNNMTESKVREIVTNMQKFLTGQNVLIDGIQRSQNFVPNTTGWQLTPFDVEINTGTFKLGGTFITVSDITLLQESFDQANTLGGGIVALVPDIYNATTSFTIPSSVVFDMSGATIDFGGGAFQILIEGTNAYSTGTLAVNYNSGSVTGTGTTWTAAMVGRSILIGDYWYEITARASDTAITISPVFRAPNVTGATYVIATTVDDVAIINGTLQNASGTLLKFRYVNGIVIDGLITTDAAQGIDGDDSANLQYLGSQVDTCTSGMTLDNVPFLTLDNFAILDITGGTGLALNYTPNSSLGVCSIQNITGVGIKFTNCFNMGLINYSIIECTSHGIEFVSGNRDVDLESGYTDTVGSDAVKLTATSDNINIDAQSFYNYTGYGINIAAATCDKTKIGLIAYGGGGSGTINDSGTGTVITGDDTAYNATTWNANLGTPSKNSVRDKIETLTGGETAALVSDTAYASSWNGVTTIAPSKNAVYDKIETIPSEDQLKTLTVNLSSANITGMFATPFEIIPAPGAGKVIAFETVVFSFTYVSIAYANGGEVRLQGNGTTTKLFTAPVADTGPMRGTASFVRYAVAETGAGAITLVANTAVNITNAGSAFDTGNSTAKVFIKYRIITL